MTETETTIRKVDIPTALFKSYSVVFSEDLVNSFDMFFDSSLRTPKEVEQELDAITKNPFFDDEGPSLCFVMDFTLGYTTPTRMFGEGNCPCCGSNTLVEKKPKGNFRWFAFVFFGDAEDGWERLVSKATYRKSWSLCGVFSSRKVAEEAVKEHGDFYDMVALYDAKEKKVVMVSTSAKTP